jgi:hypothetical protein
MLAHRATRTEIVPRRVVEAWSRVNCRILALYRIKRNQFTPNVPTEALHVTTRLKSFCWRVQQLAGNGGFAPPPDHCGSKIAADPATLAEVSRQPRCTHRRSHQQVQAAASSRARGIGRRIADSLRVAGCGGRGFLIVTRSLRASMQEIDERKAAQEPGRLSDASVWEFDKFAIWRPGARTGRVRATCPGL